MWSNKIFFNRRIYLLISYLLPVVLIFWFVSKFSVNVPYWDEWGLVNFFDKVASGNAIFADYFAQNNEHRMFFPKIIFLILAFSSRWNITVEMYFSIFLAIVSFCALYIVATHSQKQDPKWLHLFNLVTCTLVFSLVQSENWLWGFQVAWFFINTCVILAILFLVVPKKLLPSQRLLLAAICCFIASFSSAHGLLSWIAVIPTVLCIEGNARQKRMRIFLWILLFLLSLLIYQIGYVKPSAHPDILFFVKQPLIAVTYLLTLLGKSVGNVIIPAAMTGLIILFNFVFFNISCLKNYKTAFARDAAPWLSLGWFAILFALMTTVGRAGFGIDQAKSSRYTSVAILLVIAVLQMWRLSIEYKQKQKTKKSYIIPTSIFFVSFLIWIFNSSSEITQAKHTWEQRARGETCLEVIHFIDKSINQQTNNCLNSIFPDPAVLKDMAETLPKIGFRDIPKGITFISQSVKNYGSIETPPTTTQPLIVSRDGNFKLSGWVLLPEQQEPPKVVFLSYGSNLSFFANGAVKLHGSHVVKSLNSGFDQKFKWEANVSPSSMPLGENVIKAWLYEPKNKQFVMLGNEQKIRVLE